MGMNRLVKPIRRHTNAIKTATTREFDGGWNVIDNDLNLDTRFAKTLKNMYRGQDGAIRVRQGNRLFADVGESTIVNVEYFIAVLVVACENGKLFTVNGLGEVTLLFDSAVAASLPGRPAAWGTTVFASFVASKGHLIVLNGIDKPLDISPSLSISYLADPATGSNAFVPRAKYGRQHGDYLVLAGDPLAPSTVYISSKNTSGVFFGAPAPNDGVNVDLSTKVPTGDTTIKGIGRYRDRLIILFAECALVGSLGTYSGSTHVPEFSDPVDLYGAVSHRAIHTFGDDILFTDHVGVQAFTKSIFNTSLKPERVSELVDPEIQKSLSQLTIEALEDRVFAVHNRLEGQYILFIPNDDDNVTETRGFMFTNLRALKIAHWAEIRGWNWRSGCRSQQGRLFFTNGSQIFLMGSEQDPIYADFVGDQETFDDETVFTDGLGFTPVADITDSGLPIAFEWIPPWQDLDKRSNSKLTKFIGFDTSGTATFTVDMFVDNLLTDPSDLGEAFTDDLVFSDDYGFETETPTYTPSLSMSFAGGDRLGFGGDGFGQDFGGNRPSRNEQIYSWPAKGKILKLRFHGETRQPLRIVSYTLGYLEASIRR